MAWKILPKNDKKDSIRHIGRFENTAFY